MNRRDIFKAIGLAGSGSVALANYPREQAMSGPSILDAQFQDGMIWLPPTLCGCRLFMRANFVEPQKPRKQVAASSRPMRPSERRNLQRAREGRWRKELDLFASGISYHHPEPYTIEHIEIVSVCAEHQPVLHLDIPKDPWYGHEGYLDIPLEPTPAERLYVYLAHFGGATDTIPLCRCSLHKCWDLSKPAEEREIVCLDHPIHTWHCPKHQHDGPDLQSAMADYKQHLHLEAERIEA